MRLAKTGAVPVQGGARKMLGILMLATAGLLIFTAQAFAQSSAQIPVPSIPENAHARSFGEGWDCDISFRIVEEQCVAIVIPANAYATDRSYGAGWECVHGYTEAEDGVCMELAVPENAYLEASGKSWVCKRSFRKDGDACERIVLPEHAFLSDDSFGSDWDCERGYKKTANTCEAIRVPEHAYLNSARYGLPWSCERGYVETAGTCKPVTVPENAYYVERAYGQKWKCERGFAESGETCEPLIVPANAHLDRSGNAWDCNPNFQRSRGLCILRK